MIILTLDKIALETDGPLLGRSGSEESASRQVTPQQHPEPNTRLANINNNTTNNNNMWVAGTQALLLSSKTISLILGAAGRYSGASKIDFDNINNNNVTR